MIERYNKVQNYLDNLKDNNYVTTQLAAEPEREQKLFKKDGKHELKLVPQWFTAYCPYPDELCSCNKQGETKIGDFVNGVYYPRQGYGNINPAIQP